MASELGMAMVHCGVGGGGMRKPWQALHVPSKTSQFAETSPIPEHSETTLQKAPYAFWLLFQ